MGWSMVCGSENDLFRCVLENGGQTKRYDDAATAIVEAEAGSGVLILADAYPRPGGVVTEELLAGAKEKKLRLYIEYPAEIAGLSLGEARTVAWERGVVSSDFFAPGIERLRIAALHQCWYRPITAGEYESHLSVARVAGYDRAVFGLPDDAAGVLIQYDVDTLVGLTGLSRFITGRYGPQTLWQGVWERILGWLSGGEAGLRLDYEMQVKPSYGVAEALPGDCEKVSFDRSVRWFREHAIYRIDKKVGALEGFESGINAYGDQLYRAWVRGDCTGETALVFALDWAVNKNPLSRQLAGEILDYVWSSPDFFHDDANSPMYGLNNWAERLEVFYGDDNARVILPTLCARELLEDTRWDDKVVRCLLGNLRTTGTKGFRRRRLEYQSFFEQGHNWSYYYNEPHEFYAPHYEGYLWACFLWGYELTGYEGFIERTRVAIRIMMERYPRWQWTNGFAQEQARMLLPLAYLVKVEDTPEHRGWLKQVAEDLLELQHESGAIQEQLGALADGTYPAPQKNEDYGVTEAPLIQENGDPVCDMVYTANFALLGLHEAAMITGERWYQEAADRLTSFFCRIQAKSPEKKYLDGSWLRAFDFEKWDYWGSSADTGWGAWCVESGWTNTWIASVMALRELKRGMNDKPWGTEALREILPGYAEDMFTERAMPKSCGGGAKEVQTPGAE